MYKGTMFPSLAMSTLYSTITLAWSDDVFLSLLLLLNVYY